MPGIPGTEQDGSTNLAATVEFSVNMTCNNCEQKIKNVLKEKGIKDVKVRVSENASQSDGQLRLGET